MNSKSKTFIAVFAVMIMMGGSLVPLTYPNSEAAVAEADDGAGEFSLATLIDRIKEKGTEVIDRIDLGNGFALVPAGDVEVGAPELIKSPVDKIIDIAAGKVMALDKGEIVFEKNGYINVQAGGILILFPAGEDTLYKITNNNDLLFDETVIDMHVGAILSMFGAYYVVTPTEEQTTKTYPLLEMSRLKYDPAGSSAVFSYTKQPSGKYIFGITVADNSRAKVFGSIMMDTNPYKEEVKVGSVTIPKNHPDLSLTGIISTSKNALKVSGFVMADIVTKDVLVQGHCVLNLTMAADASYSERQLDVMASINANVSNLYIDVCRTDAATAKDMTHLAVIYNGAISTGDIVATVGIGYVSGKVTTIDLNLEKKADLSVSADQIGVYTGQGGSAQPAMILVAGASLTWGYTKLSIHLDLADIGKSKADVTLSALNLALNDVTGGMRAGKYLIPVLHMRDVLIKLDSISLTSESFNVKDPAKMDAVASVGELLVKGTVCEDTCICVEEPIAEMMQIKSLAYDVSVEVRGSSIGASVRGGTGIVTANLGVSVKMFYDGKERELSVKLDNACGTYDMNKKSSFVTVERLSLKNDLRSEAFDGNTNLLATITSMIGIGSMEADAAFTKLKYDNGAITAESAEITLRNGVKFSELYVKYSGNLVLRDDVQKGGDTTYTGFRIKCDEISGNYTGYDGEKNKFTITDGPEAGFGIYAVYVLHMYGIIKIYSGDAKFEGGTLPFSFYILKNTKFSAKGLTAPNFYFERGCQRSGTIVLDTEAFAEPLDELIGYKTYRSSTIFDNEYIITTKTATGSYFVNEAYGYKLIVDLSDLYKGTIEANKGNILPTKWSSESGFSMESKDGLTGSFTITRNSNNATHTDVLCEKVTYTLGYADGFADSEQHRYGESAQITDKVPTKDGCEFIGWTDGSGTLFQSGSYYKMPAKDVTLRPLFTKTGSPEAVIDGEGNRTYVVNSTDSQFVTIDSDKMYGTWTKLTINTANGSITLTKEAFDKIVTEESGRFIFGCIEISKDSLDSPIADVIGDKKAYEMKLLVYDTVTESWQPMYGYSGTTEFKVTINVHTDKDVKDFKVRYVNENGYAEDINVDSYTRCADGSYNVTFTVNHFSVYSVEPMYHNTANNLFILVGLIILVVLVCGILIAHFNKKKAA